MKYYDAFKKKMLHGAVCCHLMDGDIVEFFVISCVVVIQYDVV